MRKNLSIPKVHSLYTSLAREAWEFWGRPDSAPRLSVRGTYQHFLFGDTFEHHDGARPSNSIAFTEFGMLNRTRAKFINFNLFHLPYLYEDEVIVALLHELAHAHCGLDAQHGPEWARAAEEIGSHPQHYIITRAEWAGNIPWRTQDERNTIRRDFNEPTLGFI